MSSSTSSTVSATTVNGTTRFSGLSSGIDVDSLVESMMTAESTKLNKMKQQEQLLEWKQEQYRAITEDVTDFVDTYLNLTSSDSILKQSNFQQFEVASDNTAVSAKATSSAEAGNHTLTVEQLATASVQASDEAITKTVTGSGAATFASLSGTSFTITVDGTTRTVTFDDTFTSDDSSDTEGIAYVQAAIDEAVGSGKITVSSSDGTDSSALTFTALTSSGVGKITIADSSSSTSFTALGFDGDSAVLTNRLSTSDTLGEIADKLASGTNFLASDGTISFTINGVSFSFDEDDALSDVIKAVNADSTANVTMAYDATLDKITVTSDEMGAGNTLVMSDNTDGGTLISSLLTNTTAGVDAKVTLDGVTLTRGSNTFTQDGVTYTLNKVSTEEADISITQDTDAIYEVISNFVDAYNTLLETINGKLSEDYDSDYAPLTDDQEEEMSDTEISNWNTKAQTGLLSNDLTLSAMVGKLRTAVMSSVAGVSEVFTSIGITTSDYTEQGKLYIDEDTLQEAIASDPTGIMNLFTQSSASYSGTTTVRTLSSSERSVRTKEEGIAYKIYDVLQDYVGTIRDTAGNKGILLEKAGMENDTSDTDNTITTQLDTLADKIEDEEDRLSDLEDRYYDKFTSMETTLSELSSQYSIISSFSSS